MKTYKNPTLGGLVLALFVQGCFFNVDRSKISDEDGGTDSDTDTDTDSDSNDDGGEGSGDVSGTVTIVAGLDSSSYGVADLYLSFLAECPAGPVSPESYAVFTEESLDFSQGEAIHVFAAQGAPTGMSQLWVFLDSNDNAEPEDPQPDAGDAIATGCAEINLVTGEIITGIDLTLDMTMPQM